MRGLVWLGVAGLLVPAVVAADPPTTTVPAPAAPARRHLTNPDADMHLQIGLDAFDAKNYDVASHELDAANQLEPTPFLLYTWAQAERLAGHCPKALELYRKYLYADISRDAIQVTRRNIKECEREQPLPPPPPPPPSEPPEPTSPWYTDALGDTLAVSSVVGLTVGLVYLSKSATSKDRADHAMYLDDHLDALDEATHQRRVGGVALGLGIALAGGAAFAYLVHDRGHPDRVVTSDGRSLYFAARF